MCRCYGLYRIVPACHWNRGLQFRFVLPQFRALALSVGYRWPRVAAAPGTTMLDHKWNRYVIVMWEGCQLRYRYVPCMWWCHYVCIPILETWYCCVKVAPNKYRYPRYCGLLWSLVNWYPISIWVGAMKLPKCRVPFLNHYQTFHSVRYRYRKRPNLLKCRAPVIPDNFPREQIGAYANRTYPLVIPCSPTVQRYEVLVLGTSVSTATKERCGKERQRVFEGRHGVTQGVQGCQCSVVSRSW